MTGPIVGWFGQSWGAVLNEMLTPVLTPVGQRCADCRRLIENLDQGIVLREEGDVDGRPWHLTCYLRKP